MYDIFIESSSRWRCRIRDYDAVPTYLKASVCSGVEGIRLLENIANISKVEIVDAYLMSMPLDSPNWPDSAERSTLS